MKRFYFEFKQQGSENILCAETKAKDEISAKQNLKKLHKYKEITFMGSIDLL